MNACLTAIGYAVADFLLGSTLLLLPVLCLLGRIQQPAYRLAAARATLVALAAFGIICFLPAWPRFSVRNAETAASVSQAEASVAREGPTEPPHAASVNAPPLEDHAAKETAIAACEPQEDAAVAEASQPTSPTPVVETAREAVSSPSWRPDVSGFAILAAVELASAAAVGLWLIYGAAQTILLCRRAVAAPAFLRDLLSEVAGQEHRLPRLLLSSSVPNPVALGVLRPTIVLPIRSVEEDSRESLQSALAHEWAHVRHHDLRFLAVSRFLLLLLAAHPLYRFLWRRIREDQEALADAAASGPDRREYAAEVRIVGQKQVALEKILSHVHTRSGLALNPDTVEQDVRRLQDTRLFVRVKSRIEESAAGPVAIFEVLERPVLEYVKYVGNHKVNKKTLQKESGLKANDPRDPLAVEAGRKRIDAYYQSKGFAQARVLIIEGNKTNDRGAVFLVDETPARSPRDR